MVRIRSAEIIFFIIKKLLWRFISVTILSVLYQRFTKKAIGNEYFVKTKNGICAVKTTNLVPKDKIQDVLNEIAKLKPSKVKCGQILLKNVLNLENVDVIVTRE